jgi:hypothetical protein
MLMDAELLQAGGIARAAQRQYCKQAMRMTCLDIAQVAWQIVHNG